jgi:hypothetical protein
MFKRAIAAYSGSKFILSNRRVSRNLSKFGLGRCRVYPRLFIVEFYRGLILFIAYFYITETQGLAPICRFGLNSYGFHRWNLNFIHHCEGSWQSISSPDCAIFSSDLKSSPTICPKPETFSHLCWYFLFKLLSVCKIKKTNVL